MSGIQDWLAKVDLTEARGWVTAAAACVGAYLGWRNWRLNAAQRRREASAKEPHFEPSATPVEGAPGWFHGFAFVRNRGEATVIVETLTVAEPKDARLLVAGQHDWPTPDLAAATPTVDVDMELGAASNEVTKAVLIGADPIAAMRMQRGSPKAGIRFWVHAPAAARMTGDAGRRPFKVKLQVVCRTKGSTDVIRRYPVTLEARTALAQPKS